MSELSIGYAHVSTNDHRIAECWLLLLAPAACDAVWRRGRARITDEFTRLRILTHPYSEPAELLWA